MLPEKTNCLMCGCAVTPGCKCECHEDERSLAEVMDDELHKACTPVYVITRELLADPAALGSFVQKWLKRSKGKAIAIELEK